MDENRIELALRAGPPGERAHRQGALERALARRSRLVRAYANGQVAFATYLWDPDRECYEGHVIQVLTLRGDRIAEVTAFVEPALVAQFGLPATLR